MGRPPVSLSEAQKAEIETLAALLSVQQIADYLGIARSTFFALLERDADIARRYRRGKAKAIAHVANGLLQRARAGDNTAALFYLKTQAGWRETIQVEEPPTVRTTGARERLAAFLNNKAQDVLLLPAAPPAGAAPSATGRNGGAAR